MIRKSFVMQLHSGQEQEYAKRHSPIWPELEATLKSHGVSNYSIFLHRKTMQLFGYAEIEDEAQWKAIADTDVCQRWWARMGDIMESNPDNSPIAIDLAELFHMD